MHIAKVVLTGGPCAGKTEAQAFLAKKLRAFGYHPIFVPEAATILFQAGKSPVGGPAALRKFQEQVVDLMVSLEAKAERRASRIKSAKPIILCDRGIMDNLAYMPEEVFRDILRSRNLDMASACDARYHAIFHLRSAAIGAETFYTLANNTARSESLEDARTLDEVTLRAWIGHPHVAIVGNTGKTFDQKLEHLWVKLRAVLGDPTPLEIERKYLVGAVDLSLLPYYVVAEITQCFIRYPNASAKKSRIRRRGARGAYTYFETKKQSVRPGARAQKERLITLAEYEHLAGFQAIGTSVIEKRRHCFVYEDQYFELDVFDAPMRHTGKTILEIELSEEHEAVLLPPYIVIERDVTLEKSYTNIRLAKDLK